MTGQERFVYINPARLEGRPESRVTMELDLSKDAPKSFTWTDVGSELISFLPEPLAVE